MNVLLKIFCTGAALSFILSGCNPEPDNSVTITIKSLTQQNSAVKVSVMRNFDHLTLVETTIDSAGNSSFELDLNEPTIALIQIGKKYGEVYLAPGYRLFIKENGSDYTIPLIFSGNGAGVNNYINWVNSNVERIKWASGKGLYELDISGFRQRFDSLQITVNNFHEAYLDSVALPSDLVALLRYKMTVKFSAVQQEFKFYKLNDLNNRKWEAHAKGEDHLSDHIEKELTTLTDEVPFDSSLMAGSYADYETLLNFYWRNHIDLPIAGALIGSKDFENRMPVLTADRIKKADFVDAVREGLLAFNVDFWLGAYGITPETDSIFSDFKGTYQHSGYLGALNKTYDEFLALAPGNAAPEFEGLTREGKRVSINDLRGKLVYIDIWATWCGPCIAEIPYSTRLQQKLAKEEGIRFLNVSVDSKSSDWDKFLDRNNSWSGIHIVIDPNKIDFLYGAYKLSGIPAYMLIDQDGNIVDLKALRPSDERLERKIRELLAAQRI